MAAKKTNNKTIETLTHDEAKRKNIPTAEFQSVLQKEAQDPLKIKYPRNVNGLDKEKENRNRDLDPQIVWRGKDEQDWSELVVHVPPLYIQEKVHPKVLIDDLLRRTEADKQAAETQTDLFADFNGIPAEAAKTDFYQHDQNWSNRMILGDSLQVMASLAEREGLRGKVQCIYFDPPYGIKFNSNFQWSTTSRDVKDGNAEHITREPEQVKAFRDTWRDGIHSYLTYLRDRLTVARDLLTESGSIFVQIGDENVHRVRAMMDEVFGDDNFIIQIDFLTTTSQTSQFVSSVSDHILWFAKDRAQTKFRELKLSKDIEKQESSSFALYENDFQINRKPEGENSKLLVFGDLTSRSGGESSRKSFSWFGREFSPKTGGWKTSLLGLERLGKSNRLGLRGDNTFYKRYYDDWPYSPMPNIWMDTQSGGLGVESRIYVVQTNLRVIERCILMATDPGDLVLDPTCGSGTTAYVSEQWGRRWITIDTSRVALALARARIMGARYPYYLLADSRDGQMKEAEVSRKEPSSASVHGDIRQGFVYERVPHIMLKSIANNTEIDVIWEKWQEKLEPLRKQLNEALGKKWEEWEIPRDLSAVLPVVDDLKVTKAGNQKISKEVEQLHAQWWQHRINRQKEIDASIAAKAEYEYLYDKPYEDKKKVRVAGPFTVESLLPHRVLGINENDELIDGVKDASDKYGTVRDFTQIILENLKVAGVQQAHKEDKIVFTSLTPWPGYYICAEGKYIEGNKEAGTEKRAAIFIGPEFSTVSRPDLVAAAREAGDADFDVLITCAFNYDAHSSEFNKLGRIPVLKARMNADLHMADDLKSTGKGNLFVIFGEPDVEVVSGEWLVTSNGRMVAHYDSVKKLSGLGSLEEINRMGRDNLQYFHEFSLGREIRHDQSTAQGGSVSSGQHSRGSSTIGHGRIPAIPERSRRIVGGSGNAANSGSSIETLAEGKGGDASGRSERNRQNAEWSKTIAALKELKSSDFPLSLTTKHYSQVTIRGVDVFHPSTGEVRSDGAEGIACWFIDTDYNEESFFVRHAYFLGANDPYKALKTTLKAEINQEAWATLNSDISRPFDKPKSGRIAVKVINHLGDEVMKVFKV